MGNVKCTAHSHMLQNTAAQAYLCQQMAMLQQQLLLRMHTQHSKVFLSSHESQFWLENKRSLSKINWGIRSFLYCVSELCTYLSTRSIFSEEQAGLLTVWMFVCNKWSSTLLTCFGLCGPLRIGLLLAFRELLGLPPRPLLVFNYPFLFIMMEMTAAIASQ